MIHILYIGIGGFFGAVFRFLTARFINNLFPSLPLGTLFVNVIGSFIIGFIMYNVMGGKQISPEIRDMLLIGFIGAFTTMSALAYESFRLFELSQFLLFGLNIFLNVFLSLLAVFAGKELYLILNR